MAELEALPRNWDGQGAEPVSKEAITKAEAFLASLGQVASTFEPFADPDGSVGLEGHKNTKAAYMTISPNGEIAYVFRDGETVHRGKDVDAATMRNLINVLY